MCVFVPQNPEAIPQKCKPMPKRRELFSVAPNPEPEITPELRLRGLENLRTTEVATVYIVGLAKDQNGKE